MECRPQLDATYPMEALKMDLRRVDGKYDIHLIHRSDRGFQYASSDYVSILNDRHIRISMTGSGDPEDNTQTERANNSFESKAQSYRFVPEIPGKAR